jgi:hypothetical protein
MNTSRLRLLLLFASVATLSAGQAWAGSITVNNPSFEILPGGGLPNPCGTDCSYDGGGTPGWNGGTGQFQPGPPATTAYFDYVPDGVTVGYSNGTPFSQTVGATVQAGIVYILTVEIGTRNDTGFGGSADLVINGTTDVLALGTPAAPGGWATYTATYTGTHATAGDSIGIQLNDIGIQGDFDNVQLSDAPSTVPEPSSLTLLGLGVCSLAASQWRRFKAAR